VSGEPDTVRRFVCIHGHFYQPPRENPWLEAVEVQESAQPFHDWNERVSAEAYEPNTASRVLDSKGRIRDIMNNYARISFNVGPTLLSWLEEQRPRVYGAILEADRESRRRFGGHGSALAQVYNHMILPLGDRREKETQVRWGVRDFEHRFGREPEGMWLPETAVDLESLEILAEHGIRFTILDPRQARHFRPLDREGWSGGEGGGTAGSGSGGQAADTRAQSPDGLPVDPRRPYVQRLPSGREIVLFFYDGPLARAVAFENLLQDGSRFAHRLLSRFGNSGDPELVHIATDGETYGHHHRHGEMALSRTLVILEEREDVELTNYAEYLEHHPPEHQVEIREETSWSCAHGVERWRSDCGCSTGGEPGWSQEWRGPLQAALDHLRDAIRPELDRVSRDMFRDPGEARREYVRVLLDRSPEAVDAFLEQHLGDPPEREDAVRALHLLEIERHLQLMYTSCGWFFHDLAGIETVQVLRYAGRAIQLAELCLDVEVRAPFLERLTAAESNRPEAGNGRQIFLTRVEPLVMDLADVARHHALVELLHPDGGDGQYYCYRVRRDEQALHASDGLAAVRPDPRRPAGPELGRAATGRYRVESEITRTRADLCVAAVDLGRLHVLARAIQWEGGDALEVLQEEVEGALESLDAEELMRVLDRRIPGRTATFRSLALEEQRAILERSLRERLSGWEGETRAAYMDTAGAARLARSLDVPLPGGLPGLLDSGLEAGLRMRLSEDPLDAARVESLLADAEALEIDLEDARLRPLVQERADTAAREFAVSPWNPERLRGVEELVELLDRLPFEIDLRTLQNRYVEVSRSFVRPLVEDDDGAGDEEPEPLEGAAGREHDPSALPDGERAEWLERFARVGAALNVAPELRGPMGADAD